MSEHIHADIVRPDGTVADIDRTPSPHWNNGASTPKQRRKKQPTADAMREQLALAAAEMIRLRELLDDALPMDVVHRLLVVAAVIGFALGLCIP
jgi:hypothetical protein